MDVRDGRGWREEGRIMARWGVYKCARSARPHRLLNRYVAGSVAYTNHATPVIYRSY